MCAEIARSLGALFTDDVSITTSWCKLGPRVFLKGAPNFKQFECSNGLWNRIIKTDDAKLQIKERHVNEYAVENTITLNQHLTSP